MDAMQRYAVINHADIIQGTSAAEGILMEAMQLDAATYAILLVTSVASRLTTQQAALFSGAVDGRYRNLPPLRRDFLIPAQRDSYYGLDVTVSFFGGK